MGRRARSTTKHRDLNRQRPRGALQTLLNLVWRRSGLSLRSATRILESVPRSGPVRRGDSPSTCRHMRTLPFRLSGCPARAVARCARHPSARRERVDDAGEPGLASSGASAEAAASCGPRVRWRRSSTLVASCPPDTVTCRAVLGRAHRRTPSRRRARTAPARQRAALKRADRAPARALAGDGQGLLLRPGREEGQGGQGPLSRLVPTMRRANPGAQRKGTARTAIPERSPAAGPATR